MCCRNTDNEQERRNEERKKTERKIIRKILEPNKMKEGYRQTREEERSRQDY